MAVENGSLESLVMPLGWFCVNMSAGGTGLYEKWVSETVHYKSGYGDRTYTSRTKYRAVHNPWMGGWVLQTKGPTGADWSWYMPGVVWQDHMGAILALEIELSNNAA